MNGDKLLWGLLGVWDWSRGRIGKAAATAVGDDMTVHTGGAKCQS
jgi:hypothetical protein